MAIETENQVKGTGVAGLDALLEAASDCELAMVLTCLHLSRDSELARRLKESLEHRLNGYDDLNIPANRDAESEALPTLKWLSFLAGYKAAE